MIAELEYKHSAPPFWKPSTSQRYAHTLELLASCIRLLASTQTNHHSQLATSFTHLFGVSIRESDVVELDRRVQYDKHLSFVLTIEDTARGAWDDQIRYIRNTNRVVKIDIRYNIHGGVAAYRSYQLNKGISHGTRCCLTRSFGLAPGSVSNAPRKIWEWLHSWWKAPVKSDSCTFMLCFVAFSFDWIA